MNRKTSKEHLKLSFSLILGIFCLLSFAAVTVAEENFLSNPGFEKVADDLPIGWQIEQKNMHKGRISIEQEKIQSGHYVRYAHRRLRLTGLELTPNSENTGTHDLLGVGQAVDATPYQGKSLTISGWMAASGNAKAHLAVYVMTESSSGWGRRGLLKAKGVIQAIGYLLLQQPDSNGEHRFQEESIEIPETDSRWVIVNCTVDGKSGTANFDNLFLGITGHEGTPPERATTPLSWASEASPEITVPRLSKAPVMDGRIDEAVWTSAVALPVGRRYLLFPTLTSKSKR